MQGEVGNLLSSIGGTVCNWKDGLDHIQNVLIKQGYLNFKISILDNGLAIAQSGQLSIIMPMH